MVEILFRDSLRTIALLSGVPLAACVVAGLTVSIIQASMQIQEQSIGFAVKLIAIAAVSLLCGRWFGVEILTLVQSCLSGIQQVGR